MNKYRFIFIILIVGIYYGYTEMKKTYKKIPPGNKSTRESIDTSDIKDYREILAARSAIQKREIFYNIVIDRFYDGDKGNLKNPDLYNPRGLHGGDLKGISQKLDYIKSIGVTSIVLTNPMLQYKTPTFYTHKASGDDYELFPFLGNKTMHLSKVDPMYGSLSDLEELVEDAHKLNLKVFIRANISEVNKNSELLNREDANKLFDKTAPSCSSRTPEDFVKCAYNGNVRFSHNSPEALAFITQELVKLQKKTNLDGVLLDRSNKLPEEFALNLFKNIVSNLNMKDFNLILDYGAQTQEYYKKLFRGKSSGFIEYSDFTKDLIGFLSGNVDKEYFIKNVHRHSSFRYRKYLISDFTGEDERSIASTYNNDQTKMLKHVSILSFINTNLIFNYGEEIGAEYTRFPFSYPDMPWANAQKNKDYKDILSRIFTSRSQTENFLEGFIKNVYDKDGLIIFAKVFENQIVGYLAINQTDEEKTVFHEMGAPLRSTFGTDQINNSKVEPLDNGITFTLDPNGVSFITF